ncbi:MAG: hypothetical protein JOZ93_14795 [Sinobacteraceae bacterium]|nr:hypothetical protein [Nevskiaceae bacterium]
MRIPRSETPETTLPDLFARARRSWSTTSAWMRESAFLGFALFLGFILMPLLIWMVGNRVLGPYTHGTNTHAGPGALMNDYFTALGAGSVACWLVALGPVVILYLLRFVLYVLWGQPAPVEPGESRSSGRV